MEQTNYESLLDAIFNFAYDEDYKVVDVSQNDSEAIRLIKIDFKDNLITIKKD